MTKEGILLHKANQNFNGKSLFLSDISLEIKPNTVTMLYGKSGSGKSAIFDMIHYLVPPYTGEVIWEGEYIDSYKKANALRSRYIATIFSNFSFISLLSIKENIFFAASLCGKTNLQEKLEDIYERILKFDDEDKDLDLMKLIAKNNIKNLSNGQKEIIAIASAFLLGNKYLFVDEMLRSFPDETKKKIFLRMLQYFREEKMGIFYISHWEGAKEVMDSEGFTYASYRIHNQEFIQERGM